MNVVKCSNGHFFDNDAYQTCPHCGAPSIHEATNASNHAKEKKRFAGLFGRKQNEQGAAVQGGAASQVNPPASDVSNQKKSDGGSGYSNVEPRRTTLTEGNFGDLPTIALAEVVSGTKRSDISQQPEDTGISRQPENDAGMLRQPDDKTNDQESVIPSQPTVALFRETEEPAESAPEIPYAPKVPYAPEVPEVPDAPEVPDDYQVEDPAPSNSLRDVVKQASASSEGKTMSYFSAMTSGASAGNRERKANEPIDPVVGWLVCVHGEHFGESFNIGAGINSIGRNASNRIVLSRDSSISREKHALLTYEPKHRKFYVKPGDSSGLTYVNDEYITETRLLVSRDIVEIGSSKFVFVPLCGDDFTWEDHMNRE